MFAAELALRARSRDPGFHKRLMIFAPAMTIGAALARMSWLPHTIPASPVSVLLYQLLALVPLFAWDVARNRRNHRAYLILAATYVPLSLLVLLLWGSEWWRDAAPRIMGV